MCRPHSHRCLFDLKEISEDFKIVSFSTFSYVSHLICGFAVIKKNSYKLLCSGAKFSSTKFFSLECLRWNIIEKFQGLKITWARILHFSYFYVCGILWILEALNISRGTRLHMNVQNHFDYQTSSQSFGFQRVMISNDLVNGAISGTYVCGCKVRNLTACAGQNSKANVF
jgi:hypothetical protein